MTHEVKNRQTLKSGELKYLFFSKPLALWQSDPTDEAHKDILSGSRRNLSEISVAGGVTVEDGGRIIVDGFGSHSLAISERDSAEVAKFIKSLPGVKKEDVTYYGER